MSDHLVDVLTQTIFGVLLTHEKPFADVTPLYLAILLNTMLSVSRDDKLNKLKKHVEDKFAKSIFLKIGEFTNV